ncbi:MAG TPA: anaerobic ribonucleoside-triphosphate reductase activating protein [Chitinispirillaceae bacterium]|nr:anaerobic ribonucleoside-triphosphate reductase activating protein [Chitinispirillaceae bacterium]
MSGDKIEISAWLKNSFVDFPGTVSAVLFFGGCNLRCPWCHNPQIVKKQLPPVPLDEILAFLNKRKGLIDGVVLSGGEPTLHTHLKSVVETIRNMNLKVKLDTNGLNPSVVKDLNIDYLALDIKSVPAMYNELGYSRSDCEERLMESINRVRSMGERAEIRVPCASGFIDNKIADEIGRLICGVNKVFLQRINYTVEFLDDSFKDTIPITDGQMKDFKAIFAKYVGSCEIR